MSATRKTPMEKFEEKPTRGRAIAANCQICVGGDVDPGWRGRIRECNLKTCHFWGYRPYK